MTAVVQIVGVKMADNIKITAEDMKELEESGWKLGDPCGIPNCGCHLTDEEIAACRREACSLFDYPEEESILPRRM